MRGRFFISWDALIEQGWEFMKNSLEQGCEPDLITEIVGWLDAVFYDYGLDHDIIVEGCDFKLFKISSYEDITDFVERYEDELRYDNELFFEEFKNFNNKEV